MLLSLPLVAFYSLTNAAEFLHYSSELLPVLIITIALFITVCLFYKGVSSNFRYMLLLGVLGLLLGSVPFAKIQAFPIALTIATFVLLFLLECRAHGGRRGSLMIYVVAGFFPALLFFFPLVAAGDFHHFWNSYIIWSTLYVKAPLSIY